MLVVCDNCGQEVDGDLCLVEVDEDGEEYLYCCDACREEALEEPEAAPPDEDQPKPPKA